jgi:hypothetical protein
MLTGLRIPDTQWESGEHPIGTGHGELSGEGEMVYIHTYASVYIGRTKSIELFDEDLFILSYSNCKSILMYEICVPIRAGDVAQVVEHLPGKHKVLSSNSNTAKKKKKKKVLIKVENSLPCSL